MSFDEIFDLTAGVYFNFYNIYVVLFFARVLVAVGHAWPNHLATCACYVFVVFFLCRVLCNHREFVSLAAASARTLVAPDADRRLVTIRRSARTGIASATRSAGRATRERCPGWVCVKLETTMTARLCSELRVTVCVKARGERGGVRGS